jgi:hypothetical protein
MKDYCDAFNQSGILESVIPRKFQSDADINKFSENLEYTKN